MSATNGLSRCSLGLSPMSARCGRSRRARPAVRLSIATTYDPDTIALGASIACSGPCLTVVERGMTGNRGFFDVEASPETLARTTLGAWRPGRRVNLERALKIGDELGGHMVSGHVDGVAMSRSGATKATWRASPSRPRRSLPATSPRKGSISLDGTSLHRERRRWQPLRRDDHPAYARCHDLGRAARWRSRQPRSRSLRPRYACAAPLERAVMRAVHAGPCSAASDGSRPMTTFLIVDARFYHDLADELLVRGGRGDRSGGRDIRAAVASRACWKFPPRSPWRSSRQGQIRRLRRCSAA